jgi:hypothetical protein
MLVKNHLMQRVAALAAALIFGASLALAADAPTPTPTPRPAGGQSLSDLAKNKELKGNDKDTGKGIVISNENLSEYAAKGGLTTAKTGGTQEGRPAHSGTSVKVLDKNDSAANERMLFWQAKYRSQLERIAGLKRQIQILDHEIPGLWRDFYAWDDPAYRDSVIKPRLDMALKRSDTLETQLVEAEAGLEQIKEDARKDGAEPGWFRGIEEPPSTVSYPTPELVIY